MKSHEEVALSIFDTTFCKSSGVLMGQALNMYHDGSEGIQSHFDDGTRFCRPIFSLRLFSDSRLSFGTQLYGWARLLHRPSSGSHSFYAALLAVDKLDLPLAGSLSMVIDCGPGTQMEHSRWTCRAGASQ